MNDAFGHDAGDELLRTFATRLHHAVRSGDTIARLGGDEFAVNFPDLGGVQDLSALAERLVEHMREPFGYSGSMLDCRASIGASLPPEHGTTPEELLKNADIAHYMAKFAARGKCVVFEHRMRSDLQVRSTTVATARRAIEEGQVFPHYQPKVDILNDNAIAGFEALLRWRDGSGSIQFPGSIKATFEDVELASAISDRMLERTVNDARQWLDDGVQFGNVAVNASAADFRREGFAEDVLEPLERAGLPVGCFQLEVTESTIIDRGAEHVHGALDLLSRHGVKIALDDFGTGYASLHHLKHTPVDVIKADKSFVDGMAWSREDRAIIEAVVTLGDSLGILAARIILALTIMEFALRLPPGYPLKAWRSLADGGAAYCGALSSAMERLARGTGPMRRDLWSRRRSIPIRRYHAHATCVSLGYRELG